MTMKLTTPPRLTDPEMKPKYNPRCHGSTNVFVRPCALAGPVHRGAHQSWAPQSRGPDSPVVMEGPGDPCFPRASAPFPRWAPRSMRDHTSLRCSPKTTHTRLTTLRFMRPRQPRLFPCADQRAETSHGKGCSQHD